MRAMMWSTGFGKHPDDDSRESREFWHSSTLASSTWWGRQARRQCVSKARTSVASTDLSTGANAVSNRFVRLVAAVVFAGTCAVVLLAQSPLDRVVGRFPADQTIQLHLPPTSYWFEHSLDRVASSTRILMGIETVDDGWKQPDPSDPLLVLTGRSFGEAVELLVKARPGYVWHADGNIVHVLRVSPGGSVLARPLEHFLLENATPSEALRLLCEALQPAASRRGGYVGSGPPPSALGQHRFTMPTMSGSLLHVLDAIAEQHGALIWHVNYPPPITYPVASNSPVGIGFVMFDGWGTAIGGCVPA